MEILEGKFPEGKAWRLLILLTIGESPRGVWKLAKSLVKAYNGELLLVTILPDRLEGNVDQVRQTQAQARAFFKDDVPIIPLIVESKDRKKALRKIVAQGDVDFVLVGSNSANWPGLNSLRCTIGALRGEDYDRLAEPETAESEKAEEKSLKVLMPTSAGPNTIHALSLMTGITREAQVTALYVSRADLGPNEEALGRSRLRQVLNFVDANDRVESKLLTCDSVIDGIVDEAAHDYDLVIIGASQESSLDKALFGNVPAAVVRESKRPVMVIRQADDRVGDLLRNLGWAMQELFPRMSLSERTQAYVRIRRGARPDIDFFVLIALATAIAALGLLADSPAVVIGAMLVAPLMSPIAGLGLAIVLGHPRFLRLAVGAVLRGFFLAFLVGILAGLIPVEEPLTEEVLGRTQPTLIDLGIAIFSGMAVAYALCRSAASAALPGVAIAAALVPPIASAGIALASQFWIEGLGALLLFLTNLVAISTASALVFLVLGFRPAPTSKESRYVRLRSARIALLLLVVIASVLAATTFRLARESATQTRIRELIRQGSAEYLNASVSEIEVGNLNTEVLDLDVTIRSTRTIPHQAVVDFQLFIATELQREIALNLVVIPTTELDPFIPPTQTPTATATETPTPGPTPTFTGTPTFTPQPTDTPTATPAPSETPTSTATVRPTATPTLTATPTATPRTAVVSYPYGLNLRREPASSSELLALLEADTVVILLDGQVTNEEGKWQQVSVFGLTGWVLGDFLAVQ